MRTDAPDEVHPGSAGFFAALADLVRHGEIVDRPRGRAHPRIPDVVYPLDYGYLAGTTGGDGEGIDVFVGSAAGAGVVGVLLTADLAKRDAEIKVLVDCSPEEVGMARGFAAESSASAVISSCGARPSRREDSAGAARSSRTSARSSRISVSNSRTVSPSSSRSRPTWDSIADTATARCAPGTDSRRPPEDQNSSSSPSKTSSSTSPTTMPPRIPAPAPSAAPATMPPIPDPRRWCSSW